MLTFNPKQFETIDTKRSLQQWAKRLAVSKSFCIDSETTGLDVFMDELVGVALAVEEKGRVDAGYIPVAHHSGRNLPVADVLSALAPSCSNPRIGKVLHNALYDMAIFKQKRQRLDLFNVHDPMFMAYALHGHTLPSLGMDYLAKEFLDWETIKFKDVVLNRPGRTDFRDVPTNEATDYAAEDTAVTFVLAKVFQQQLRDEGLWGVYIEDRKLIPVLHHIQMAGAKIDVAHLNALAAEWAGVQKDIQARADRIAGRPVSLSSSKQCMEYLEERGVAIPINFKTRQPSLDKDCRPLLPSSPWVDCLNEFADLKTLLSTFAVGLPKKVHPITDAVHTYFNFTQTKTGRGSSSGPNLQNIPTRTKEGKQIREAFIADRGETLIGADYSQIELRVLAHIAEIPQLRQAFHDGVDIHAATASEMFGVPVEGMPSDTRARAKAINFGIVYGISEFGLARQLKIDVDEAAEYIDTYYGRFPGILDYMEESKEFARKNGYVETLFGRRVYTEGIRSSDGKRRGRAERLAANARIQGTAADLMRMAMVNVHAKIEANPVWGAKMFLTVHDELLTRAKKKYAPQVQAMKEHEMIHAADHLVDWRVPIIVEGKLGSTWRETK